MKFGNTAINSLATGGTCPGSSKSRKSSVATSFEAKNITELAGPLKNEKNELLEQWFGQDMSDAQRRAAVYQTDTDYMGSLHIIKDENGNKRLLPVFLGQNISMRDETGGTSSAKPGLLGTTSSDPRVCKPIILPGDAFDNFYALVQKSTLPWGLRAPGGTNMKLGDNAMYDPWIQKKIDKGGVNKDEEFTVLMMCRASPFIKFSKTYRGKVDETAYGHLANLHPLLEFWLKVSNEDYDKDFMTFIMKNKNDAAVKKGLPPKIGRGHHLITPETTDVWIEPIAFEDTPNEEVFSTQFTNLKTKLEEMAGGQRDDDEDSEAPSMSDPIPRRIITRNPLDNDVADHHSRAGTTTTENPKESEYLGARFIGLFITGDGKGVNGTPVLSETANEILAAPKNQRVEILRGAFQDLMDAAGQSESMYDASIDLREFSSAMLACIANCFLNRNLLTKIQDARSKDGFSIAWLLNFLKQDAAKNGKVDSQRFIEDMLGEVDDKKTALNTNILPIAEIEGLDSIITLMANTMGWVKTMVKTESGEPVIFWAAKKTFRLINSAQYRRRMIEHGKDFPHLPFFLFTGLERLVVGMSIWGTKQSVMRCILSGKYDKLDLSTPNSLIASFVVFYRSAEGFLYGDDVASTSIWRNSDLHLRLEREKKADLLTLVNKSTKRGALGGDSRETKRQTTLPAVREKSASKAGIVSWKGDGKMPLPTYKINGKAPCGAFYKEGAKCNWGKECRGDHTPWPALDGTYQKSWFDLVKNEPKMRFNEARVEGAASINAAKKEVKGGTEDGDKKPPAK